MAMAITIPKPKNNKYNNNKNKETKNNNDFNKVRQTRNCINKKMPEAVFVEWILFR